MVRNHSTYHMMIPRLYVDIDVVMFELERMLDIPFGYLVLSSEPMFIPCWYEFLIFFSMWWLRLVVRICFFWMLVRFVVNPYVHSANEYWIILWVLLVRDKMVQHQLDLVIFLRPIGIGVCLWLWFDRCANESFRPSIRLKCICVSVHWYEITWWLSWRK